MARSLTFIADGDVKTRISITENADGTLTFDISVIGDTVGDLRGLFLDLNGFAVAEGDLVITEAADVSGYVSGEGDIDRVAKDANIKGSVSNELGDFDLGIEFGTSGLAQDDIQATSFTLGSLSGPLTLDMLSFADFGLRYTSVGTGETRDASAKIGDTAGGVATNDALEVAENQSGAVNLLANDSATGSVVPQTITLSTDAGVFGTLTIAADGTASVVADGPAADAMSDGDSAQFVVQYAVESGDEIATAQLTITITGETDGIPLFTEGDDTVNFNTLDAGIYDPASFYDALGGFNIVTLPSEQKAAELGFDLTQTFVADGSRDVVYGSTGDDNVAFGDGPNNTYVDNGGDDYVSSTGDRFSIFVRAGGNDVYELAAARNTINYSVLTEGVILDLVNGTATGGAGNQTISGTITDMQMTNGDDVIYGSDITPSTNQYSVFFFDGNDTFVGGAAREVMFLQSGTGSGHKTLDGGGGNDVLAWNFVTSDMVIDAQAGTYSGYGTGSFQNFEEYQLGNGSDVFIGSATRDIVSGRAGDDRIETFDGSDIIYDASGNSYVDAGSGNDIVLAAAGNSTYIGGAGNDALYITNNPAFADGAVIDYGAGTLSFTFQGVDYLSTFEGFEVIRDGLGADTIIGTDGDDVILSEFGSDVVTGGAGADVFRFLPSSRYAGDRVVTDFNAAEGDVIAQVGGGITRSDSQVGDDVLIEYSDASGAVISTVTLLGVDILDL